MGIDAVLAVELVAGTDGILTGDVVGAANCRGRGKVERLRTWVQGAFGTGTPVELWAYGDSTGDAELLASADHPTWIGKPKVATKAPKPTAAAQATAAGAQRRPEGRLVSRRAR
jgi:phosphoserine phosphatase